MRPRCPDSSPGKGQTGIASAQEKKADALTHSHSCNLSRGNVCVWGGHPTGWTTIHITCRGLESPTCPQVPVTHTWPHPLCGPLSQPEGSCTMTQACSWLLVTWLKPIVKNYKHSGEGSGGSCACFHPGEESAKCGRCPGLAGSQPEDPRLPPPGST